MRLLLCTRCNDVVRLTSSPRSCLCKATRGMYKDDVHAVYSGKCAIPLGFDDSSFSNAAQNWLEWRDQEFKAFVVERDCPTFRRVESATFAEGLTPMEQEAARHAQEMDRITRINEGGVK